MPRPAHRTSYIIKKKIRTPGGRLSVHYERKKPGPARCARCGKILQGVVSGRPKQVRKTALTRKRPNRYFGGVLCSSCLAELIKAAARSHS